MYAIENIPNVAFSHFGDISEPPKISPIWHLPTLGIILSRKEVAYVVFLNAAIMRGGALAHYDGGAIADDVDAVFALPHVIVARVGGIAHEGALAPLPHRLIFRRIAATHAAFPLSGFA